MARKIDGFKYVCDVNTIFGYMQEEIDFAISDKVEFVTDFFIKYRGAEYHINIWNNTSYSKNKIEIDIMLNEKHYNSLDDFKNNAILEGDLIKNIKENLEVIVTYHDSVYLEKHQVCDNKLINTQQFIFNKSYVNTLLFCSIFLVVFAIASRFMFKGQPYVIIGYIFFDSVALLSVYICLYYKRKEIVYKEKSFIEYGIFSKKVYLVKDIVLALEKPVKGITIIFNNQKKFTINPFMTNYCQAKKILQQNDIKIKDE